MSRFAIHKLVRHPQQVSERLGIDAGQANQYRTVAHVVIGQVINSGVRLEQLRAVVEIHADN
jgi:hypothetical protein